MEKNQYIQKVHERLRMKLKMRFGTIRKVIFGFTGLFITQVVLYVVLWRIWGVDSAIQQAISFIIPVLISVIFLAGIVIYWRYYAVPTEIFSEQQNRISEMDKEQQVRISELELEIKKVESEKLKLVPSLSKLIVTECNDHPGTWGPIGIDVRNYTSNDVTDIEIELTAIISCITLVNSRVTRASVPLRSNSRFKTWANVSGSTIKSGSHEVVNFAQVEGEKFTFMLESGFLAFENSQYFIPRTMDDVANTTFEVFFEIRGKINGHTSQQNYRVHIVYESTRSYSGEAKTGAPQIHTFIDIQGVEPI